MILPVDDRERIHGEIIFFCVHCRNMSAPILTLRSKGIQDQALIVNPDVSFFQARYPRHTNFTFSDMFIQQTSGQNTYNQEMSFQLTRSGDLVSQMILQIQVGQVNVECPDPTAEQQQLLTTDKKLFDRKVFCDDLGRALIERVELQIGGYTVEELSGDLLHIWDKLSRPAGRSYVDNAPAAHGGCSQIDVTTIKNEVSADGTIKTDHNMGQTDQTIYVPLQFTCCSMQGLALPMIAVQFHDTRIKLKLRDLSQVSIFQGYMPSGLLLKNDIDEGDTAASGKAPMKVTGGAVEVSLLCRYVFLDDAERKEFALSDHQYLITENQYQSTAIEPNQSLQSWQMYFNHPVKELIHYFVKASYRNPQKSECVKNFWNFTMDGDGTANESIVGCSQRPEAFSSMNLLLNQQRVYENGQPPLYYSYLLPTQYHTRVPEGKERVYIMPFALDPETWKPTGTINFSRIETAQLQLEFRSSNTATLKLPQGTWTTIARNFNQLKVKSGMGGKRWAS